MFQIDQLLELQKNGAAHTNSGTINVSGGKTLTVSGVASLNNTTSGTIQGTGTLNVASTSFTNDGHIRPGAGIGILSITGSISQSSTGSIDIEIGGNQAGTKYDQLRVNGVETLNGNLNISLVDNYVPLPGDTFQIITYGSHTGEFTSITPKVLNGDLDWGISYSATGVQLAVAEAAAGLRLQMVDGPNPHTLFGVLTYSLTVANSGPETATNVVLTDILPSSALFTSATASQGSCSENSGKVTCALADIEAGKVATVTINVVPTFMSTISNTAWVKSDTADATETDNTFTLNSLITEPAKDFDISKIPIDFGVTKLSANYHLNNASGSLTMTGLGFDGETTITLVAKDGTVYSPGSLTLDSQYQITTSFDFSQLPVGRYDLVVTNASGTQRLENAFEVIPPQPRLETHLVLPGSLGRHAVATLYIEYKNTGDAPMPAPMLRLVSDDADNSDKPILTMDASRVVQNFWSLKIPAGCGHSVQFLAAGDDPASPGYLQPGESGRVPIYYLGLLPPYNFSDTRVEFEIREIKGNDPNSYWWPESKEDMKPESMPQQAWDVVFANLTAGVGESWGDYITNLAENAEYLYRHGGKTVSDAGRLMQFEIMQAVGLSPVSILAGSSDLTVEAPGMALNFSRYYPNSIISRHIPGPLGKGWSHNWQMSVEAQTNGNVLFHSMGGSSLYTLDSRGGYFPPAGDHAKLRKDGDIFTLTAATGIQMVFNANGSLNFMEDLNGNRITAEYSGTLLTRLAHSSGRSLTLNYDGAGQIGSITDDTGTMSVAFTYSGAGDTLASVRDVLGRTTAYTYQQSGPASQALAGVAMPDGTENTYDYDANGRLSTLYFNGNPQFTIEYGPAGAVSITNTVDQATTVYYYDELGSFVETTNPLNYTTLSSYDADHNLTSLVRPDGAVASFIYENKGNLTRTVDADNNLTQFSYGTYSRLTAFTDAESNKTGYAYDMLGNNTARISPDASQQSYEHDPTGEINRKENRRGKAVTYTRDNDGRVVRQDYADGSYIEYEYDPAGYITAVADSTGVTTLDYYGNHLLHRITYPNDRFLEYIYDTAGRRTSMTDETGHQVSYSYNPDGLLATVSDESGELAAYSYDGMQRLTRTTLGNGVSTTYQYDIVSRLNKVTNSSAAGSYISSFEYEYDSNNRRTKVTSRDGAWQYEYDSVGQLTNARFASGNPEIPSQDISYVYDKVGNRTQEIVNGASAGYTVNTMKQYNRKGNFSYNYDQDGNLVQKTDGTNTWTYEYNDDNRLVRSTGPDGETEYIYNGLGQLVTTNENGTEHHYTIDPSGYGNMVGEYDADGNQISRYSHGLGLIAKDNDFYTFDGNGNTSEMTNMANEIVNFYLYEPFGKTIYEVKNTENSYQFVGQLGVKTVNDDLVYMRNRFYSASLGRFMSEDPIGLAGWDVSFYRYVGSDPINWVDPDGYARTLPGPYGIPIPVPAPSGPVKPMPVPDISGWIKDHYNPDNWLKQSWEYWGDKIDSLTDPYEARSGDQDPQWAKDIPQTVDPGRDQDGNCNPCPPDTPVWYHCDQKSHPCQGHYYTWNPDHDCVCHRTRVNL